LKSNIAIGTIQSVLMLLSSIIMLTIVLGTLVSINPEIAILLLFGFMSFYWLVSFYTRRSIKSNSELISKNSNGIIKIVQEGLGGIRDVIIDNSQNYYCAEYRKIDVPLRKALGDNSFIGSSPRYIIEATGMMVIILVSLNMADDPNSSHSIPVLGMIALAMQKILPLIQQGYKGFTVIKSSYASFNDVVALLKQPLPNYLKKKNHAQISYKKEITLSNVNFKYSADAPWILKNINLKIKKGSVIGIIGETGSGKSTLVDIIMGLLDPIEGNLLIDGKMINGSNRRSWQSHIAHVPQSIYLLDGSIEQNIAFGESEEKIDYDKLGAVSKMAQISDLISLNKGKLSNVTGERGGRLSGGQRQRIGIARAFYKNSDVLVLDEATSALDEKTEKAIMKSIENISDELTIIIIAHRLSTLKNCDSILKISNKKIAHINSVKDIYNDKK